ncbi:SDR family oxidoreductase [Paenibacillus antri]|uniref:SDR family oxidoreductase n=1 Tax=Paenibacillus antri TaxID=2582848 RepID=A0A5R9GDM8_9BACL|nr:SDR family oxidoreductase [Paenibacillus antri]TLS53209.1 SDR family oxidoreductase [Paenibacillus antri]
MKHRNVLITGASGGIGYELAKRFAANQCNLILVARDRARLEEIRSELTAPEVDITIIEKDLTEPMSASEVYEETARRNIRVHVLVNNAGIGWYGPFRESPLRQQLRMIRLNATAVTELTYLYVNDMIEDRYGRILNIASISSFLPTPMMSVYAATKAYVSSFSEALNSELRNQGDISVTALCPGFTKTNFLEKANLQPMEALLGNIALDPAVVARDGYRALLGKKAIRISGGLNKFLYAMIRALPRSWMRTSAALVFKKP